MDEVSLSFELPACCNADEVFRLLCDFSSYPRYSDRVLSVDCKALANSTQPTSLWRVKFREGILQWTEADHIDPQKRLIKFELVDGDLEAFSGFWAIENTAIGAQAILFYAKFDLGIPSLSHMLNPLAHEALSSNANKIVTGLLETLGDFIPQKPNLSTPSHVG
tara:strand:+ start:1087 stop:1578 length:492 start_codon:yes stop_codon:yes gene_type:complete